MKWNKVLKELDIHWATCDEGKKWHIVGVHHCDNYHSFCGQVEEKSVLERFPSAEGEPSEQTVCVYCLYRFGKFLAPLVKDQDTHVALRKNMIGLQENIRLREMAWEHRN